MVFSVNRRTDLVRSAPLAADRFHRNNSLDAARRVLTACGDELQD
jgi:hypothetical protein